MNVWADISENTMKAVRENVSPEKFSEFLKVEIPEITPIPSAEEAIRIKAKTDPYFAKWLCRHSHISAKTICRRWNLLFA